MDKRYQVFVSSTYEDLREERQAVMQILLESDFIPSGMELFPAADEDQWTLIQQVIDECDYYIVIVGGKYGSIGPKGVSYTEMEYQYALAEKKPIAGFLHSDPNQLIAQRIEKDAEKQDKLEHFRQLVRKKMVRTWASPEDLAGKVSTSLAFLKKRHPGTGWVRGDQVPDEDTTLELLRLRKRVEALQTELEAIYSVGPEGTQDLAQGDDHLKIKYTMAARGTAEAMEDGTTKGNELRLVQVDLELDTNWHFAFAPILGKLAVKHRVTESSLTSELRDRVAVLCQQSGEQQLTSAAVAASVQLKSEPKLSLDRDCVGQIFIQLRALGIVEFTEVVTEQRMFDRQPKTIAIPAYQLTPYGEKTVTRMLAVRRARAQSEDR